MIGDSRIRYLYETFQSNSTLGSFTDDASQRVNRTLAKDQYFQVDYIASAYLNVISLEVS